MKTTFDSLALIIAASCIALLLGIPGSASAEYINVDEIIFETGDPALEDLNPLVTMSFDSTAKLLTVVLSNEASYVGSPDAGNLLTGLGFNLPSGVSIEDTALRNSTIQLPAGSVIIDPVSDPDGTSGISLSQDDWGYANNVKGGHFVTEAQLSTSTVLSCMKADAAMTFAGNKAENDNMDQFDYGLQGLDPTPGHPEKRSIRNAVAFSIYLSGPAATDWNGLLSFIEDNAVVVSYGSPNGSHVVPEPAAASACGVLFAALLIFRTRRRFNQ